LRHMAKFGCKY